MGEFSNEHSITRTNLVTRVNIRKPVGNESEYWEENETCSLSPIMTVPMCLCHAVPPYVLTSEYVKIGPVGDSTFVPPFF